jgi:hypothetical protein
LDGKEIFTGAQFTDKTIIHKFNTGATPSNGCPLGNARFDLTLTTGEYGEDISWTLKDGSGKVLQSGSGYGSFETFAIGPYCVPRNAPYEFQMLDSYGDGLATGSFSGRLDGKQIFAGGEFTTDISFDFNTSPSAEEGEIALTPTEVNLTMAPTEVPKEGPCLDEPKNTFKKVPKLMVTLEGNHMDQVYGIYDCVTNLTNIYYPSPP